jgi:peptidyl-tRNA hydrolase
MNVLYILMRNDFPSMNPGKAMAQASHASNAFIHTHVQQMSDSPTPNLDIINWQNETEQGFGTVLVLGVNQKELDEAVKEAILLSFPSGVVVDPSYPYKVTGEIAKLLHPNVVGAEYEGNKEYTLYRTEVTCGYVFGNKDDIKLQSILGKFKLHP